MGKECASCYGTGQTVSGGEIFDYCCPDCEGVGYIHSDKEVDDDAMESIEGTWYRRDLIARPIPSKAP